LVGDTERGMIFRQLDETKGRIAGVLNLKEEYLTEYYALVDDAIGADDPESLVKKLEEIQEYLEGPINAATVKSLKQVKLDPPRRYMPEKLRYKLISRG
jgi:hypothetical protein